VDKSVCKLFISRADGAGYFTKPVFIILDKIVYKTLPQFLFDFHVPVSIYGLPAYGF
jgi:hypothetical protein